MPTSLIPDSTSQRAASGIDVDIILVKSSLCVTPENRVAGFEKNSLRTTARNWRLTKLSSITSMIRHHFNNLGFPSRLSMRQRLDFRAAFNEMCRRIDVRA